MRKEPGKAGQEEEQAAVAVAKSFRQNLVDLAHSECSDSKARICWQVIGCPLENRENVRDERCEQQGPELPCWVQRVRPRFAHLFALNANLGQLQVRSARAARARLL